MAEEISYQTKILQKVNKRNAIILMIVPAIGYLFAKTLYYHFAEDCTWVESLHEMWLSIWHHMDFFGYLIGMFAVVIGFFIAKIADESMKNELKEMKETEKQIMLATDDLKANATQRTITKFPELFEEIKLILNSLTDEGGELYIMNKTSSFGRIHSFNKKFAIQFNTDTSITIEDKKFINGISKINDEIVAIERIVEDCFRKFKNVKIVTSNSTLLDSDLIATYFQTENSEADINAGKGLKFYKWNSEGKIELENSTKENTEKNIKEFVEKHHKETLDKLKNIRTENGFNDATSVIIEENDSSKVKMQMYLVEFMKNGSKFNRTLVIFAVDQEDETNNKDRVLIGIASSSKQIFNVFKTFFDN